MIVSITPKAQQSALIGPGTPNGAVQQQVAIKNAGKKYLAGAHQQIDTAVLAGRDGLRYCEVPLAFVLQSCRPLAPGMVEHISEQAHLQSENILTQLILLNTDVVLQHESQRVQVQSLAGGGQFDAIAPVKAGGFNRQAVVVNAGLAQVDGAAPFLIAGVSAQQGPGHQAAAGAAFNGGYPARCPDPAAGIFGAGVGGTEQGQQGHHDVPSHNLSPCEAPPVLAPVAPRCGRCRAGRAGGPAGSDQSPGPDRRSRPAARPRLPWFRCLRRRLSGPGREPYRWWISQSAGPEARKPGSAQRICRSSAPEPACCAAGTARNSRFRNRPLTAWRPGL